MAADIWVHHAPPSECGIACSSGGGFDFGSDDLRSALSPGWNAKARLVLCGHVHNAPRWNARCGGALCINAATPDLSRSVPRHVLIDLEARTAALHVSGKASGRVRLLPWG